MSKDLTRREFMSAAGGVLGASLLPMNDDSPVRPTRVAGQVVLFQGDSITDSGRNHKATEPNTTAMLGNGYPLLISSGALHEHPQGGLRFFNRGISGNRVPDLQARWQADAIDLQPDIISILVGVNDFWHTLTKGYSGTVQDYESGYTALLTQTRRALPDTRIVVLEPFVLRCGAVDDSWFPEFDERRVAAKRVAQAVGAEFIGLQAMFDELSAQVGPEFWAADGVHPTPAGHAAIAARWREVVGL